MMGTEIFKIDASWAEKLTKTRVSFLTAPTVYMVGEDELVIEYLLCKLCREYIIFHDKTQ